MPGRADAGVAEGRGYLLADHLQEVVAEAEAVGDNETESLVSNFRRYLCCSASLPGTGNLQRRHHHRSLRGHTGSLTWGDQGGERPGDFVAPRRSRDDRRRRGATIMPRAASQLILYGPIPRRNHGLTEVAPILTMALPVRPVGAPVTATASASRRSSWSSPSGSTTPGGSLELGASTAGRSAPSQHRVRHSITGSTMRDGCSAEWCSVCCATTHSVSS